MGIKDVPITSKNLQSNAISKYMHQTMAIMLKTILLLQLPQTTQDVLHIIDDRLSTTMRLMRLTISMVLKASLVSLAFPHDMLLNITLIAALQTITHNREANDLLKSNQQCINTITSMDNKSSSMITWSKGKLPSKPPFPLRLYHHYPTQSWCD